MIEKTMGLIVDGTQRFCMSHFSIKQEDEGEFPQHQWKKFRHTNHPNDCQLGSVKTSLELDMVNAGWPKATAKEKKKKEITQKKTKGVVIKDNDGLHCLRKVNQEDRRIRANEWVNSTSTEEILLFLFIECCSIFMKTVLCRQLGEADFCTKFSPLQIHIIRMRGRWGTTFSQILIFAFQPPPCTPYIQWFDIFSILWLHIIIILWRRWHKKFSCDGEDGARHLWSTGGTNSIDFFRSMFLWQKKIISKKMFSGRILFFLVHPIFK